MDQERVLKTPALNIEEAALLPALSGHADGGAALQAVRRDAERMEAKQVSNTVSTGTAAPKKQAVSPAAFARQPRSRAALHHVLTRKQGGGR